MPRLTAKVALIAALILCLSLVALSQAEITQRAHLRLTFTGRLTPRVLPRSELVPVKVSVAANISSTNGSNPPQLSQITIAINHNGRFDPKGLPICRLREIQPSTTVDALAACRSSLVGEGHFFAHVLLPGQAPFPSNAKVFAFNSVLHGRPAILAHVYGTKPAPASYILPFEITRTNGTFGTVLHTRLPKASAGSGYITGIQLTLGRNFTYRGRRHSYLSAGCPAPRDIHIAPFPLARGTFAFQHGKSLVSTITRSCKARG